MEVIFRKNNIGLGRRKQAIARVFLLPGEGNITINKKLNKEKKNEEIKKIRVKRIHRRQISKKKENKNCRKKDKNPGVSPY